MPTSFTDELNKSTFADHGKYLLVSSATEFLGLEPSDCELIIQKGEIRKDSFLTIASFEKDIGAVLITPRDYVKSHSWKQSPPICIDGSFSTHLTVNGNGARAQSNLPTLRKANSKPIRIEFNDLFIRSEDIKKIRIELEACKPNYGNFQKAEWIPEQLADMNEASTYFFSNKKYSTYNRKEMILTIESWLKARWTRKTDNRGEILLAVAAAAILPESTMPNKIIDKIKITEPTEKSLNEYTSPLLSIINELALQYWLKAKNKGKYSEHQEIVYDLNFNYGITGRLAKVIATLIRPTKKH
ncbi:hypothetical protein SAMN05216190_106179 [Pseudomonas borbori]|uniref:Uncharacterized protein n=2 Tax=Pseudomonas borbori TaxID=289003 RepID=A0A1I5NHT7_9PSED|nr:hypothetical protein SAMN05216190_106179 [Pseudomonas borbori]